VITTYERGILQGQREVALRLLELKFGLLSADVRQRVEGLSLEQLDQLFLNFVESQSLNDLCLED
jgi:hypothetical protein